MEWKESVQLELGWVAWKYDGSLDGVECERHLHFLDQELAARNGRHAGGKICKAALDSIYKRKAQSKPILKLKTGESTLRQEPVWPH